MIANRIMRYLIVLLLAGCATADYVWYKPGATAQALEDDQRECETRAIGWTSRAVRKSALANCMREKAWRLRLKE
jgi:hypothetical protein